VKLTETLRRSSAGIWKKIYDHPFVVEMYRGDLPVQKFRYYIIQDYSFLIGITKAFSLVAAKSHDYNLLKTALELAYADATIEMDNYKRLIPMIGLKLEDVLASEPAPTNYAYINHILVTCSLGTPLECLVSILPCFWTYMEIAEVNKKYISNNRNEVYRKWIEAYLSKEYREATESLINIVDELWGEGGSIARLNYIFKVSSRYEYMFWDMAYKLEKWKPESGNNFREIGET